MIDLQELPSTTRSTVDSTSTTHSEASITTSLIILVRSRLLCIVLLHTSSTSSMVRASQLRTTILQYMYRYVHVHIVHVANKVPTPYWYYKFVQIEHQLCSTVYRYGTVRYFSFHSAVNTCCEPAFSRRTFIMSRWLLSLRSSSSAMSALNGGGGIILHAVRL